MNEKSMTRCGTILLIDDEPLIFEAVKSFLGDQFDIEFATTGTQGLMMVDDSLPDLILLDVGLPDINGFDVCRTLKSDPKCESIPVVFLTAYGSVDDETAGLSVGAIDYISKPFNEQVVNARVNAHFALKQQHDELRTLILLDELTQISNRRGFDEMLHIEWRRALRYGSPLSLVLMDIDAFKKFNDGYGHLAGDKCLREVAQRINASMRRSGDLLARYGGEEFGAILPNTPHNFVKVVAERARNAVEDALIPHAYSHVDTIVTISTGAATIIPAVDGNPIELIAAADNALYRAKEQGGNVTCVEQYNDEQTSEQIHAAGG